MNGLSYLLSTLGTQQPPLKVHHSRASGSDAVEMSPDFSRVTSDHNISSYLHNIYTISTRYLHYIYTAEKSRVWLRTRAQCVVMVRPRPGSAHYWLCADSGPRLWISTHYLQYLQYLPRTGGGKAAALALQHPTPAATSQWNSTFPLKCGDVSTELLLTRSHYFSWHLHKSAVYFTTFSGVTS